MNYTKICQGWIYIVKNKVNGKMYVGQTIDYNRRKYEHLERWNEERCALLRKAYNKYGIDNFEMFPVLTFRAVNKKVCFHILNLMEKFYVQKYNTYNNGYNCTIGGAGIPCCKISDEERKARSLRGKGRIFSEETKRKISERLTGKKRSASAIENISKAHMGKRNKNLMKAVLQYSIKGDFIREYSSVADAHEALTGDRRGTLISSAIRRNTLAGGYMWKIKDRLDYPKHIEPYKDRRYNDKKIYYYTKDNCLISSYSTIAEASLATQVPCRNIINSANKNVQIRKSNWWSYVPIM